MRLHLELWVLGFILELWKRAWEVRARYYIRFDLWFKQYRIEITLYKRDMPDSGLMFHIRLPLFHLCNDMMTKIVKTRSIGSSREFVAAARMTNGKILGKVIGGVQ